MEVTESTKWSDIINVLNKNAGYPKFRFNMQTGKIYEKKKDHYGYTSYIFIGFASGDKKEFVSRYI